MKFDTIVDEPYTAEVWKVVSIDPDTEVKYYAYDRTIRCHVVSQSTRSFVSTREELELFDGLRSIKDVAGVEITPDTKYQVKTVQPKVNTYGYTEGFIYTINPDLESV